MKQHRYIWNIICLALLLTALVVPYYALQAESDAPISVIKSVGINTSTQQSYFPNTATAADLYLEQPLIAEPKDLLNEQTANQFSWQLLRFLQHPGLNTVITLTIITSYLGFAILLFVFKKHKKNPARAFWHWLAFFLKKPSLIFLELAPVEADSRWVKAFHSFKKYHRTTQVLALASIIALIVKVSLTAGITLYLLDKTRAEVLTSQLQDDGKKVHPLDTLTYRLDWSNVSQQIIPVLQISDPIPAGTTLVEGSASSSSAHSEQVTIERSGNTSQVRAAVQNILPGDTGYIVYNVQVDIPNSLETISSRGEFSIKGVAWSTNSLNNPLETGSIGDLVWKDDDSNKEKNAEERGLENIKISLYLERSDLQSFNPDTDQLLLTTTTDGKGKYNFPGITAATYWIDIDQSTLPSEAVSTFNSYPKKIILSFSNWISLEKKADYNGADFGFFVPEPASEPAQPTAEETDDPEAEEPPSEPTPENPPTETAPAPSPTPRPTENKKQTATPHTAKKTPETKEKPLGIPAVSEKLAQSATPAQPIEEVMPTEAEETVISEQENNGTTAVDNRLTYEKPVPSTTDEQWDEVSSYPEKSENTASARGSFFDVVILLSIIAFIAIISTVSHLQPHAKKQHRPKKRRRQT